MLSLKKCSNNSPKNLFRTHSKPMWFMPRTHVSTRESRRTRHRFTPDIWSETNEFGMEFATVEIVQTMKARCLDSSFFILLKNNNTIHTFDKRDDSESRATFAAFRKWCHLEPYFAHLHDYFSGSSVIHVETECKWNNLM